MDYNMLITVVVGNPKPDSRTLQLALGLAALIEHESEPRVVDLARYAHRIFEWPSEELSELNEAVAASDLVIFGSPTYKATYTGLLKGFLDRYPAAGLKDVCAIPVMTGANRTHAMGPEVNLRPLLVELGAIVPTRGLYFETPHMARADLLLREWVAENAIGLEAIRAIAKVKAGAVAGGAR
ncbi:hypothetical protein GCM10010399_17860 [Dactylosporangium fulvum]|uniref:NAD(P)H-dependent oxidoreductase n=1 Tax=Dactylosporangium fulvum TaxID=53359 RepID=A0ABY5VRI9_9ACTN|nr:NAD(P)H-dependent oxidoreductase [Dactylosporangium fulvum]UWP80388.1 NAD(P)H-dependent oxidoreductase [Dactylosporangium fulvum]